MMKETILIRFLYKTGIGRCILKILVQPWVSQKVGSYLNSRFSRWMVPLFVKKYGINLDKYKKENYHFFNEFFIRERKAERIDITPEHLISPCDGYLSVYPIEEDSLYRIKHVEYRLEQLLENQALAKQFAGGYCMIFRLTPQHYHRYCYVCDGMKVISKRIEGKLHCVRPVAYTTVPVFVENSREYTEIESSHWGRVIQMEIGALLVGKIHNHTSGSKVIKGQEKGYFEFGGSTIVILIEKNRVCIDTNILQCSTQNQETEVSMGSKVGSLL